MKEWLDAYKEKSLVKFNIYLYIDKEGRVFTVKFWMDDRVYQKLDLLPPGTLKKLYDVLMKQKCREIKKKSVFVPLV